MLKGLETKLPWLALKMALLAALFLVVASGNQAPCGEGTRICDQEWNLLARDEADLSSTLAGSDNLIGELDSLGSATISFDLQNQMQPTELQNIVTGIDTAKFVRLTARDSNDDLLSYSIVSLPSHGTISGTAPNIVYIPENNYTGYDSFVFNVSDEMGIERNLTVGIDVLLIYHPPSVRIRSPLDGKIFAAFQDNLYADVPIHATVSGEGVYQVEFFDGLTPLGIVTCPADGANCPATLIAKLALGTHTLIAKATDSKNETCISPPVVVVVNPSEPTAKITSPAAGEIFTAPADISIGALVTSSADTEISSVEFYANSQKLATVNQPPYSFDWNGVESGVYSLVAKVTDTNGISSISESVLIVVVPVKALAKSDLALTMNFSPEPIPAGGFMNYLLTVTNKGPDTASDVTVENFLPEELTYVGSKPSQGTYEDGIWSLGSLTNYRSAKMVLNVQVPANPSANIPNTAYVFGNEYDPDNSNNHATAYIQVKPDNLTAAKV